MGPSPSPAAVAAGAAPTKPAAEKKVRIAVVEDDDDSSDGDSESKPSIPVADSTPSVAPPATEAAKESPAVLVAPKAGLASYEPSPSPVQLASSLKDEGNRLFSAGDLTGAVQRYSQALELDPANSLLHANMALAKLRSGDARGCLSDASVAVALDPTYHKAMHRRAMAKRALGQPQAARDDLKSAHDMLEAGHRDRAPLAEEMRAVIQVGWCVGQVVGCVGRVGWCVGQVWILL